MVFNTNSSLKKQLTFTLFVINITFVKTQYIGEKIGNIPYGYGQMTYENGDVYQGEFENGLKEGFGIMTYANKLEYAGDWVNDMREGQGVLKNLLVKQKPIMKGNFRQNVRYLLDENAIYYGDWKNDMYHGLGVKANVTCDDVEDNNCKIHPQNNYSDSGETGCTAVRNTRSIKYRRTNPGKIDFYFGMFQKNKIDINHTAYYKYLKIKHMLPPSDALTSIPFDYAPVGAMQGGQNINGILVYNIYSLNDSIFNFKMGRSCLDEKRVDDAFFLFDKTTEFLHHLENNKKNNIKNVKKQILISKTKKDLRQNFTDTMDILEKEVLFLTIKTHFYEGYLKKELIDLKQNFTTFMNISDNTIELLNIQNEIHIHKQSIIDLKKQLKQHNISSIALICILVIVFIKYSLNRCKNYFTTSKNKRDLKKEILNLKKDFKRFKKENKDLKKENKDMKNILRI